MLLLLIAELLNASMGYKHAHTSHSTNTRSTVQVHRESGCPGANPRTLDAAREAASQNQPCDVGRPPRGRSPRTGPRRHRGSSFRWCCEMIIKCKKTGSRHPHLMRSSTCALRCGYHIAQRW